RTRAGTCLKNGCMGVTSSRRNGRARSHGVRRWVRAGGGSGRRAFEETRIRGALERLFACDLSRSDEVLEGLVERLHPVLAPDLHDAQDLGRLVLTDEVSQGGDPDQDLERRYAR